MNVVVIPVNIKMKNKTPKFRLEDIAKIPEDISEIIKEIIAEVGFQKKLSPALVGTGNLNYDCNPHCECDSETRCSCDSYCNHCKCVSFCNCDEYQDPSCRCEDYCMQAPCQCNVDPYGM
jgi:hypothetical protein